MKYICTIVLLLLFLPACVTVPVIDAEAVLDIPARRGGEFETLTTMHTCSGGTLGAFAIESVAFDVEPLWPAYQYVGWYMYGEDDPFISTQFDEQANLISVNLFGNIVTSGELLDLYPTTCDAGRALITGKRV